MTRFFLNTYFTTGPVKCFLSYKAKPKNPPEGSSSGSLTLEDIPFSIDSYKLGFPALFFLKGLLLYKLTFQKFIQNKLGLLQRIPNFFKFS